MANGISRRSSIFPGLLLLFVGMLLLLHNYRSLSIFHVLEHWWPLILILWGAIKIYERTTANRSGDPDAARIGVGEIFLVLGLLALLGIVVGVEIIKDKGPGMVEIGDKYDFDLMDLAPKAVPADARITIHGGRGDISVRSSDEAEIRISGKKNVRAWNERDAQKIAEHAGVEIVKNGDGYEIRPTGAGDSRISVDMEVAIPKKATLTIRNDRGDITVADMATPVNVTNGNGDIEVRDTGGDVSIDTRKGEVKVSDTKGNVKISGHGGEINVSSASGQLTLDGEFYGAIKADKIAKGVRFVSKRTDLTLSQLPGHMEAGPGSLQVFDAPGNLSVRTEDDITLENAGGKVKVDNRRGSVDVRFTTPPKDDIEINNASAAITLTLPDTSSFDIVADCHSGDTDSEFHADSLKQTSTESGDSHLEGKYGSGRGPKITLKTSYGSISLHKTSSDVPAPPARPKAPAPAAAKPPKP